MNRDVHPAGPAADLLAVVEIQVPLWFRRIIEQAARAGGADPKLLSTEIDLLVANEALPLVDALRDLLFTDVDEQRTNPLTLFRRAVSAPTALLRDAGVPQPARDGFAADRFPDDVYRLGPANWSEVSPVLHDPGIAWGAWKAMTILERRRAAGLR